MNYYSIFRFIFRFSAKNNKNLKKSAFQLHDTQKKIHVFSTTLKTIRALVVKKNPFKSTFQLYNAIKMLITNKKTLRLSVKTKPHSRFKTAQRLDFKRIVSLKAYCKRSIILFLRFPKCILGQPISNFLSKFAFLLHHLAFHLKFELSP